MTEGTSLFGPKRLATVVAAAGMLLGSMGVGHAEPTGQVPAHLAEIASPDAPVGPRFVPSAEAQFETSFADVADPLPAAVPAHAVDMSSFEPPVEEEFESLGTGVASYYGKRFAGRPTASGETFDPAKMTAAHRTLPFGTMVRVTNPANGKTVTVRINDRGPFHAGRTIDLSRGAAEQIGLIARGSGRVELDLIPG